MDDIWSYTYIKCYDVITSTKNKVYSSYLTAYNVYDTVVNTITTIYDYVFGNPFENIEINPFKHNVTDYFWDMYHYVRPINESSEDKLTVEDLTLPLSHMSDTAADIISEPHITEEERQQIRDTLSMVLLSNESDN